MKLLGKLLTLLTALSTLSNAVSAQADTSKILGASTDKWDLKRCVEYAIFNNISVRQADVQKRVAELMYEQAKYSRIPNASFNTSGGVQFGRSIDPTTNLFTTRQTFFQGFQFNTDATIYNWNRINHNITATRLEAEASAADVDKNRNDIALNVATAYLQALLTKVQINISGVQLEQSQNQLADTRKRVNAGTLPELNAVELEAQVARDSASMIGAQATYEQNLLNLKALLNLDAAMNFEIAEPSVELIPVDPMADLMPDIVYQLAMKNQPAQRANDLRKQSLEYSIKSVRSALYPTLFASGGLASDYSDANIRLAGMPQLTGYREDPSFGSVTVEGMDYFLKRPSINAPTEKIPYRTQISDNFRQNIVVGISVPIFNGYRARTNYERSKLDVKSQELVIEQSNQKLKQDIYTAYSNAISSLQRFNASKSSLNATQKAFDFARRRYELGLLSTLELITSQTNLTRAKIDMVNAQFDYVFRMKVLEFYKGQGLKL